MSSGRGTSRVPAWAEALLVCPTSQHALVAGEGILECADPRCGRRFPVGDGAPILIDPGQASDATSRGALRPLAPAAKSVVHEAALRHLPALERNVSAERVRSLLADLLFASDARPIVLNLGGKHGAAASAWLRSDPRVRCVEADPSLGAQTHLVVDLRALPFSSGSFDAVIADAVLEHVSEPARAASEIRRVLRPGGVVHSDVPFLLGVHGGRYDFERFTALGHRALFAGFEEIERGVSAGPGAALAHAVQSFLLSFVTGRRARFAIKTACRLGLFWIKYFDAPLARRPGALDAALGTYFVGRKSEHALSEREILAAYRGATPDLYGER